FAVPRCVDVEMSLKAIAPAAAPIFHETYCKAGPRRQSSPRSSGSSDEDRNSPAKRPGVIPLSHEAACGANVSAVKGRKPNADEMDPCDRRLGANASPRLWPGRQSGPRRCNKSYGRPEVAPILGHRG